MNLPDFAYIGLLCLALLGVLAGIVAVAAFMLVHLIDHKLRACPACGRKSAGVIVDTDEQHIKTHIDRSGRNPRRIRVEKITDHYQCEYCGHTWTRSFERSTDLDLDKQAG